MALPIHAGAEIPEHFGAVADEYQRVRQLRLDMDKEVALVKARETELREHLISGLAKSRENGGDTGAAGMRYRVQIVDKEKVTVDSSQWDEFFKFVSDNGRWDLIQRRVSDKPLKELMEEGVKVPGASRILIPDVSVTKIA